MHGTINIKNCHYFQDIICRDFYGIDSHLSPTCFFTRNNEGKKKNIYFTSPAVRDVVLHNHQAIKVKQQQYRDAHDYGVTGFEAV